VAGCCECGDEPSGSCATELVSVREPVFVMCNNIYSHMTNYHISAKI
jgi:hypothetical protein